MFFLFLCKLFLWNMCWFINVVHAQPGYQSLKHEEYQQGIKQCDKRCLDTGECRGFSYDSSALRCSLAFSDNFQYKSTARKCGTTWCKRGERCLTTRKSRYVCVSYLTQEEEHLPDKEVKLDLKDLGPLKTHHYNIYGCDTTTLYERKKREFMFILTLNQLIAININNLKRSYTWPIVHSSRLQLTSLTCGPINISSRDKDFVFIMLSFSNNDHTCLVSIKESTLFTMKTIDLKSRKSVKSMTKSNHYQLYLYVYKLYLIFKRPGRHHELNIAKLESKGNYYELKQLFSINTGFVRVTGTPLNFFVYDKYAFVLVKNILLRWTREHTYRRNIDLRNASMRMYRWDSPRNTICPAVHQCETLYTVDKDSHLLKMKMYPLLRLFKSLDK